MKEIKGKSTSILVNEGLSYQQSTVCMNHKTETSAKLFHSHKMHLAGIINLFGLFTEPNDRFPYPFI